MRMLWRVMCGCGGIESFDFTPFEIVLWPLCTFASGMAI
jgi:hypothetical protein